MNPLQRLKEYNTRGNLWIYTLSLLKEKQLHAWLIQSLIEKRFNFRPGRITAYRVLYRLEKEGFVKSEIKQRRRIYKITERGKRELEKAKIFYKSLLDKLE